MTETTSNRNNTEKGLFSNKPSSFIFHSSSLILYLTINGVFVMKYSQRTPFNPLLCLFIYIFLLAAVFFCIKRIPEKYHKHCTLALLAAMTAAVIGALIAIDPMSVRVDRWSATTYFLDALFSGQYPYGVHTHLCETNFPSPFPFWHYLNIPFWLLGDVGIGLIAVLLITVYCVWKFSESLETTFIFTLLLAMSPAYWWEVLVRSDGLSNALLVFCVILWMNKLNISFRNRWITTAIICGLAASTRLSAIIPMALFLMLSFFKAGLKVKLLSPIIIIGVIFFLFAPYIFWDAISQCSFSDIRSATTTFFSRNPFMSQTSTGNIYTMLLMSVVAVAVSIYSGENFRRLTRITAIYIFVFFLIAICYNHFLFNADISIWDDAEFDVSYLSLALPYCLSGMRDE